MKRMFLTQVLILVGIVRTSEVNRGRGANLRLKKLWIWKNSVDWMRYFWNLDPWKSILGHQRSRKKKLAGCMVSGCCAFFTLRFGMFLLSGCQGIQQRNKHCEMKESVQEIRSIPRRENFPESWKFDPQVSKWSSPATSAWWVFL